MGRNTREADSIIRQAWAEQFPGVRFTDAARHAALTVSRGETGYGVSKYANGNPTDENWGALKCPGDAREPRPGELWDHCVIGIDTEGAVPFRGYPDAVSGARDFLRVWARSVGKARDSGDIEKVASAMREAHYFTAPLSDYVKMLKLNAPKVAADLDEKEHFKIRDTGAFGSIGLGLLVVGAVLWWAIGDEDDDD